MNHIIQKILAAVAIAAPGLGAPSYGQDAFVNISTRGPIDPADAEASLIGGFSLASEKRVILRTIGESLADQGVAQPIADVRYDVYKLDLAGPASNEIIGQNDNWENGGPQLQIVASGLAPGADSDSAMIMTLDAGVYTLNSATVSGEESIALIEIFGLDAVGVGSTIGNAAGAGVKPPAGPIGGTRISAANQNPPIHRLTSRGLLSSDLFDSVISKTKITKTYTILPSCLLR